ncbi:erythrocyte membrane associated protein 1 [Plasmodium yoelii yoelii]|uniref:Erythrocyte membrane associated protein 1 n=2 Tax=Plasmodium yoelii TaxID=5861 RepID=A0AAF0AZQ7_PLAYO|nr:erythrocyte membrane associated protein 1 [Plasmodium yoelii yoelii]
MFVQTAIDLDDQNTFDTRRYKNAIVKSANSLNINVNANDYGQMKSKKKMFPNLTGLIIQKKSDHVCVTYINSIYSGKSLPKSFRIPRLKAKKMVYLANLIKDTINQ